MNKEELMDINNILLDILYYNYPKYITTCFVKCLLKKGADVNAKFNTATPASTPLHCASMDNNYELVKLLLENGADVNINNKYNETPLYCIIAYCRLNDRKIERKIIKLLISKGADINAKNGEGITILSKAIQIGRPKPLLNYLRKFGAKGNLELEREVKNENI